MLLVNGKAFCRSQKAARFIYLWSSPALQLRLVFHFYHLKSICGLTGWQHFSVFNRSIVIFNVNMILVNGITVFRSQKRCHIHLVVVFTSITSMAGYTFLKPKINLWTKWWHLLSVFNKTLLFYSFSI